MALEEAVDCTKFRRSIDAYQADELFTMLREGTPLDTAPEGTDGEPTGTTPDEVRAAAEAAKGDGILLFTIGLGQDVDQDLLRDVATRPEWYFYAPDTSDLAAIYEKIAYEIPCKPMWP